MDLVKYADKIYSQFGEAGILLELIRRVYPRNNFLEIGCCSGPGRIEYNCGWKGWFCDKDKRGLDEIREFLGWPQDRFIHGFFTLDNVVELLMPIAAAPIGVLSIDIDGNDYWLWKKLVPRVRADIVIIEYQNQRPVDVPFVAKYDEAFVWDNRTYNHGASLVSMVQLAAQLGYHFVGRCPHPNNDSPNLFFVANEYRHRVEGD